MNDSTNSNCCVIELHYCLKDDSHSMDALLFNRCKKELLNIVRGVACQFGVEVKIKMEMLGEGGILCCFIISPEFWNTLAIGIISGFVAAFLYDTVKNEISELKSKIKGVAELEEQMKTNKTESEPYKRASDPKKLLQYIDKKIVRCRSNFYANLFLCDAVEGLTIRATDENGAECFPEKRIAKDDFKRFIMPEYELEPVVDKNAIIENISRVWNGRKYNWRGRYNNRRDPIRFNFRDKEQNEGNNFDEGSTIECQLEIHRKIGNGGRIRMEYEVTHVYNK